MTINAEQLLFILENTPPQQNIMLVGRHGIGKSQILENFFQKKGFKVTTLFLGQMSDPGDLIGLPEKNLKTGRTDFMLPYWFPIDEKPVVLFLDELNRARPEVLQTVMDLTLNRKLAGKSLPNGSRIISAVNGGGEYQLTDLDPALISRFNICGFVIKTYFLIKHFSLHSSKPIRGFLVYIVVQPVGIEQMRCASPF
ncbi:MAG: AAA family ATPase [Spirochaetales bacterium]|nr:AAA family ATPase [Spirochaetales bacterium]